MRTAREALRDVAGVVGGGPGALSTGDVHTRWTTARTSIERARDAVREAVASAPELYTAHGLRQAHDAVDALDRLGSMIDLSQPGAPPLAAAVFDQMATNQLQTARDSMRYLRLRRSESAIAEAARTPAPVVEPALTPAPPRASVPIAPAPGRHRATEAVTEAVSPTPGRHRAPEPTVGRHRAPEPVELPGPDRPLVEPELLARPTGRHRAPEPPAVVVEPPATQVPEQPVPVVVPRHPPSVGSTVHDDEYYRDLVAPRAWQETAAPTVEPPRPTTLVENTAVPRITGEELRAIVNGDIQTMLVMPQPLRPYTNPTATPPHAPPPATPTPRPVEPAPAATQLPLLPPPRERIRAVAAAVAGMDDMGQLLRLRQEGIKRTGYAEQGLTNARRSPLTARERDIRADYQQLVDRIHAGGQATPNDTLATMKFLDHALELRYAELRSRS